MSKFLHVICEACWIDRNANWHTDETGFEVLDEVRRPVLLKEPEVETCCFCEHATIFGAFLRADPAETPCFGIGKFHTEAVDG